MSRIVWTVPATVVRVVDGDTVRLRLDLGWEIETTKNCRIIGINAREMNTPEGKADRLYAVSILPVGSPMVFVSHQLDKYGRPLGQLVYPDGSDFATKMLNAGHAVVLTY